MWISKNKEERQMEYIDTALELFAEKGYELTSINDILKRMNITKGSFYHNFQSKQDLLVKVIEYLTEGIMDIAKRVSTDQTLTALDKLRRLSDEMMSFRHENAIAYQVLQSFHNNEKNALMAKQYTERVIDVSVPLVSKILKQGQDNGVFNIINVSETSELYIQLLILYKKKIVEILSPFMKENQNLSDEVVTLLKEVENIYIGLVASLLGVEKKEIDYLKVIKKWFM